MKRLVILLLPLLLLCGCVNQEFRVGGIDLRKTLPTQAVYLYFGEDGVEVTVRYYKPIQEEDSAETVLSATGATAKAALAEIERITGKEIFYMRYAALVLGGNFDLAQLSIFRDKTMYVFSADENVCESPLKDAAETFHFESRRIAKDGKCHSIKEILNDTSLPIPKVHLKEDYITLLQN